MNNSRSGVVSDVGRPGCMHRIGRVPMAFDSAPPKGKVMDVKDIPGIIAGLRTKFSAEEALHALHVMCGGKVEAEQAQEAERQAAADSAIHRHRAANQAVSAASRASFAKHFPNAAPLRII